MNINRKYVAYPNAKVYVVPYEEFQKMNLNDTETKHTCGEWVELWQFTSIKEFYKRCRLMNYGYEKMKPKIIGTSDMPAFFMKNFELRPEFFEVNNKLSKYDTPSYGFWIETQIEHFKGNEDKLRFDVDLYWYNLLGWYEDVEEFAEEVVFCPDKYNLGIDLKGKIEPELLASEEFMSCFVYGGESNYFFRKPNW